MAWWKLLIRKGNTLLHLSPAERSLLLQALIWLPLVALSLRLWGLHSTQKRLALIFLPRSQASPGLAQVWLTVRMVRLAVRYSPLWSNCLKRSLVLWALLRGQGITSELRIGVQRQADQFQAHAWVEYQSMVLNDSQDVDQQFNPFTHSFEVKL